MGQNITAAADGLLALAAQFQAVQDAAVVLKELGSIDQAIGDRKKALETAVALHEDMKTQVNAANDDLVALRDAKLKEAEAADERIKALTDEATENAHQIVIAARTQADAVTLEANAQATKVQEDSNKALVAAKDELAKVQAQLVDAAATRDQAIQDTADAAIKMDEMRTAAQAFAVTPVPQPIFASTPNQSAAQTKAQQQSNQSQP